jgi:hypothetical protein
VGTPALPQVVEWCMDDLLLRYRRGERRKGGCEWEEVKVRRIKYHGKILAHVSDTGDISRPVRETTFSPGPGERAGRGPLVFSYRLAVNPSLGH